MSLSLGNQPTVSPTSPTLPDFGAVVLAGTLGSGKTTLLNRLIRDQAVGSFVVIENDIGTNNIDAQRLRAEGVREVFDLRSGCLCCEDIESLKEVLTQLKERPESERPERIFIETTGIADPREVKALVQSLSIPSVTLVTLSVDHFVVNKSLGRIEGHVEAADIVALTHWEKFGQPDLSPLDIIDPEHPVYTHISHENPSAHVVHIDSQGTPIQGLTDLMSRKLFQLPEKKTHSCAQKQCCGHDHKHSDSHHHARNAHGHSEDHSSNSHDHSHSVHPVSLVLHAGTSMEDIMNVLNGLRKQGVHILRAKGNIGGVNFDIVHDTVNIREQPNIDQARGGSINIIADRAFPAERLESIGASYAQRAAPKEHEVTQAAAAELVLRELAQTFREARTRTAAGTIAVDFEADEGDRYLDISGVDQSARLDYIRANAETRLKVASELDKGLDSDRALIGYNNLRVGRYMMWLVTGRREETNTAGMLEQITAANPGERVFQGILETHPEDARQIGELGDWEKQMYPLAASMLAELKGDTYARELASKALNRAAQLLGDDTFSKLGEAIAHSLR